MNSKRPQVRGRFFFPPKKLAAKLMTARIRKTTRRILPTSIDNPPRPLAPSKKLTNPKTKNAIAALNINTPFEVNELKIKMQIRNQYRSENLNKENHSLARPLL